MTFSLRAAVTRSLTYIRNTLSGTLGWRDLAVTVALLVALILAILSPTMKALRTVEFDPRGEGVLFPSGASVHQTVMVPAGEPAYVVVWVREGHGSQRVMPRDYKGVALTVAAPDGTVVRTAAQPELIKRADRAALRFAFEPLLVSAEEPYTFVVTQTGMSVLTLLPPLADHVREGEVVAAGFEVAERRNWLTLLLHQVYEEKLVGKDISAYLHRGQQIARGENPYSCVTEPGSCTGYPAHLPGVYLVAAGATKLGVTSLQQWGVIWRAVAVTAWVGIALLLFGYAMRRGQGALAAVSAGFWLFNRWSVDVLRIAHTDFVGVFFLLLAFLLAGRWPLVAALLFGVSLTVKQIGIVLVPLFLIVIWQQRRLSPLRFAMLVGFGALVPLAATLPFLLDDPAATIIGLLNAGTRESQVVHGFAPSLDAWLDITGASRVGPLLVLLAGVYVAAWRRTVGLFGGALMIMASIIAFNPVLYNQYFVWFLPFIPLVVAGFVEASRPSETRSPQHHPAKPG